MFENNKFIKVSLHVTVGICRCSQGRVVLLAAVKAQPLAEQEYQHLFSV